MKAIGLTIAALLLVLASSCGFPAALSTAHKGLKGMSQEAEPRLAAECLDRAKKCKADGVTRPEDCASLMKCRKIKEGYALGAKTAHRGLAQCNRFYREAKKAGIIK